MSKLSQEEVQSLRSRICHGEQGLISTLTPEQFLALLSYDYDTGFAAGKASAQKEILCMLAADGMPPEKIALLLRMEAETVREILATKRAHIEKCRKKLDQIAPFFLIPHHPYALSLLLKISDGFRVGTDWQQQRLGAAGPGRDPGVREKQQRQGSVSLRLRRGCVLRVLPIHRRFDDAGQTDPGGLCR